MEPFNFSTYLSPFTWRYGSDEMRTIFSEKFKFEVWRKIWVALAQTQYEAGLLSRKELDDLKKNQNNIDIERILEIEKETKHDVVAAIKEFAEKAKIGGGKIHLGATSMDIVDNTEVLRVREAMRIVEKKIIRILLILAEKIKQYASFPCIGYTHLQPAEPTTVGYRLSLYAQDFLTDLTVYRFIVQKLLKAKGFKGAVGTSASYTHLLHDKKISAAELEEKIMKRLGIQSFPITSQVYPRKMDFFILSHIAGVCQSSSKFAADLRILQSPNYGEWSEPFGKKQVGSSAMPFKKNPINSEKICSLSRYVTHLTSTALQNAELSYLERTLDDSANRRIIIPESFLATDEILITLEKILTGLVINEERITRNLNQYAPFAATETLLMESVKKGANRQEMHETLRVISLDAWGDIQRGKPNSMTERLKQSALIRQYIETKDVDKLMDAKNHIGDATYRALRFAKHIISFCKST